MANEMQLPICRSTRFWLQATYTSIGHSATILAIRGGNPENWIRVLNDLSRWDINLFVPGQGAPVTKEKLSQQRAYLQDMLSQVRDGIRAGGSMDELARDIDLSRHGTFGVNPQANATSIRAVYRFLQKGRNQNSGSLVHR